MFVTRKIKRRHEVIVTRLMNLKGKIFCSSLLLVALSGCSSFWKTIRDPTADNLSLTSASAPLPAEARKACIALAYEAPKTMHPGERASVHLLLTDLSSVAWPYSGEQSGKYQIRVGDRWIDRNGNAQDDGRGLLSYDLKPGA